MSRVWGEDDTLEISDSESTYGFIIQRGPVLECQDSYGRPYTCACDEDTFVVTLRERVPSRDKFGEDTFKDHHFFMNSREAWHVMDFIKERIKDE